MSRLMLAAILSALAAVRLACSLKVSLSPNPNPKYFGSYVINNTQSYFRRSSKNRHSERLFSVQTRIHWRNIRWWEYLIFHWRLFIEYSSPYWKCDELAVSRRIFWRANKWICVYRIVVRCWITWKRTQNFWNELWRWMSRGFIITTYPPSRNPAATVGKISLRKRRFVKPNL